MRVFRPLLCTLLLAPALAVAQPTPGERELATEKLHAAGEKSKAGDHVAAAELYLEASTLVSQPLFLLDVGSEYEKAEKPSDALKQFCKYIELEPAGSSVGKARTRARKLFVQLGGDEEAEDAEVCQPIKARSTSSAFGRHGLTGTDRTDRTDDGRGDKERARKKRIEDLEVVKEEPTHARPPTLKYAGIGVGSAGILLGLGGVYYGLRAKSISDEIKNHDKNTPWDANLMHRQQEGKDANTKAVALLLIGGAAIAAGVTMYVLGSQPASGSSGSSGDADVDTSLTLGPAISPDGLGFVAAGHF